jgi:2-polyprenyl-6-methoxyphenol hydroxylase-like FAD-dependent oxidoreductase
MFTRHLNAICCYTVPNIVLYVLLSRHGKVEKQVEADVIFGNDGAHSVVRKEIMKKTRYTFLYI